MEERRWGTCGFFVWFVCFFFSIVLVGKDISEFIEMEKESQVYEKTMWRQCQYFQ